MDICTGDIYPIAELMGMGQGNRKHLKKMIISPTEKQCKCKPIDRRAIDRIGRNELCPCDSGKKFKFCCLNI